VRIRRTPTPPKGLRNRVYLLWREEAFNIGFPASLILPRYVGRRAPGDPHPATDVPEVVQNEARALVYNLEAFKTEAQYVWVLTTAIAEGKFTDGSAGFGGRVRPSDLPGFLAKVWYGYTSGAFRTITRMFTTSESKYGHQRLRNNMQHALPPPDVLRRHGLGEYTPFQAYIIMRLEVCRMLGQIMENTPMNEGVGEALLYYLDQGVLMADVHPGNVGIVRRDGYDIPAITDPGQAVLLNAELPKPKIKVL